MTDPGAVDSVVELSKEVDYLRAKVSQAEEQAEKARAETAAGIKEHQHSQVSASNLMHIMQVLRG